MEWYQLMKARRLGKQKAANVQEGRSEFQRDYDRIVFSSAFRRLQNKTQVVPLPESDFIHNRLTHSLEVSCVGRSLGFITGNFIVEKSPSYFSEINLTANDFADVVSAACLAHDIGNPPFGHTGEDAIQTYFRSEKAKSFLSGLNEAEQADLMNFEGNAAGFRLLTRPLKSQRRDDGGLKLTLATLGSFIKYPKASLPNLKFEGKVSTKKFGFFQTESALFKNIVDEIGLIERKCENYSCWSRHPLAFLMEAADDICYHIIDFEDGFNLKLVSYDLLEAWFMDILGSSFDRSQKNYSAIKNPTEKAGYLRAKVINKIVIETSRVFMNNYNKIMNGKFENPLINEIESATAVKNIIDYSINNIYTYAPVVENRAAGFEVLGGLLDSFLNAVFNDSKHNRAVRSLIPKPYIDLSDECGKFEKILRIVEFISGMTDTYAIRLYKNLKGISLPNQE